MDVEKAVAAAGAEGTRKEEVERLLNKVRRYSLFLYVGSMIVTIAPRLAPESRPAVVPSLPAGYGLPVTCASFTVATLVVQEMLARVLERRPAPAPRLTPEAAWPLGISTWMFLTMFFHSYLCFGGDDAVVPSLPAGYGLPVTCASFTVATLVVQEMLSRVLERRPAPAPRLTPEAAWPLGISTWMFLTMFFHSYLRFGGDDYFVRSCDEWAAACVASSLNLFIAALTVSDCLA